ncbi:MAG: sigma 54-interacting transcriptional regulator [Acidobacteria bacterium]|nr:sigma 54-interacting transcriptional regulator [Acidobacteriota bacterium]
METSIVEGSDKKVVVLNVDDSRDSLRIKTVTLRRAGFAVIEAETGGEAIRLASESRPDVVLLDVNLPDLSGYEVCRRIRTDPAIASTLIVQISACFTKGSDKIKGLDGGADGYLTSPVEPPLLVATIKSLLRVRDLEGVRNPLFQYWQAAFDAVEDGIALLDHQGAILRCNARCEALLDKTLADLAGQSLGKLLLSESSDNSTDPARFNYQSRSRQSAEIVRSGRWLKVSSDPVIGPEGRFLGTVCILSDITDRKNLESSLQQFQHLSGPSDDVYLAIRPDGKILDANKAAVSLYGFTRDELLSRNVRDLFAEPRPSPAGVGATLKDCGGIYQKMVHRRKDGSRLSVEMCSRYAALAGGDAFLTIVREAGTRALNDMCSSGQVPGTCMQDRREAEPCGSHATVEELYLFADPSPSAGPARYELGELASFNRQMQGILRVLPQVSASNCTVLLQGETGTGKELLARTIHNLSPRASKPMMVVNCATLPDSLLESELFGYRAGAFTGAARDKPGLFTLAGEGTIFLDEIGDLSPVLQTKLLRVLQEKTYLPLGSTVAERTAARFIAATNRPLSTLVREGRFRSDLYYRINVVTLELPPLRDRKEDLPLLVEKIIRDFNREYGKEINGVSSEVMAILRSHEFPGNIRELINILEHAHVLCTMPAIEPHHLPAYLAGVAAGYAQAGTGRPDLKSMEFRAIMEGLERNRYNRLATARELGIHKSTLFRKLKAMGIALPRQDGRSNRRKGRASSPG